MWHPLPKSHTQVHLYHTTKLCLHKMKWEANLPQRSKWQPMLPKSLTVAQFFFPNILKIMTCDITFFSCSVLPHLTFRAAHSPPQPARMSLTHTDFSPRASCLSLSSPWSFKGPPSADWLQTPGLQQTLWKLEERQRGCTKSPNPAKDELRWYNLDLDNHSRTKEPRRLCPLGIDFWVFLLLKPTSHVRCVFLS